MNLNKITYNEDLTILNKTEQPIRAYAQQANTIEVLAPVSGFNVAYMVIQGLANGVVNPRLRATQRLFMSPLSASGNYSRWSMVIPGPILNDMSLMNSTGVRMRVEFWYISGDCLGVEKYNTEVTLTIKGYLAADYPDATDGQFVRVIDTNTDWYYDADTLTWVDYEDQYQVGVSVEPTSAADFTLEKGIYADAPSHAPTNTELILQELAAKLGLIGGTMSGDIDMDDNDINNVKTVVFYNTSGTAVLSFDGTNLLLNRNAVDEEVMTVLNEIGDLANVVETGLAADDILIYNGTNWVNITKTAYLAAVNGRIDTNVSDIADRELISNKVDEVVVGGTTDQYVNAEALYTKFLTKVDKAFTIAGLDMQSGSITLSALKTAIGEATTSANGLLSASDKTLIDVVRASIEDDDAGVLVDTIKEVLAAFDGYPESTDLMTYLATKVDKVAGKELSENDLTDVLKGTYDDAVVHANTTDGTNPHVTTYANIVSKPTTFEGFGLANGSAETFEATTHVKTPKVVLATGVYIEYDDVNSQIKFVIE